MKPAVTCQKLVSLNKISPVIEKTHLFKGKLYCVIFLFSISIHSEEIRQTLAIYPWAFLSLCRFQPVYRSQVPGDTLHSSVTTRVSPSIQYHLASFPSAGTKGNLGELAMPTGPRVWSFTHHITLAVTQC